MILPYLPRLILLCFALFFVVCVVVEMATLAFAPMAIRFAEGFRPRSAARFLLALRLLPPALGGLIVFGLCIPSYLWLEPNLRQEKVGITCLAAAVLGAAICAVAAARSIRALAGTFMFGRHCQRAGTITSLTQNGASPVCLIAGHGALLGVTGVFRPWLVVSQGVLDALSAEQINVALRHEAAHLAFRDNLQRLLLLLVPRAIPLARGRKVLDAAWARFTEWAADDWAVEGNPTSSLSLATALVRMARMDTAPRMAPLSMSLLDGDHDLFARVNRLLRSGMDWHQRGAADTERNSIGIRRFAFSSSAALLMAGLLAAIITRPATLHSVHFLLEKLIH
jgi:hypothetical protein